ncbi:hypothetical protein K9N68_34790 (plasmid) [Kovacikia minuta CCNUW1]|uniref:hypothetical protein n=1 Tax=Kovacikia minuta TaxID=2931930 RepID=UPI001CCF2746|nr:hypothetical protein [Kovacikia minuta]UBF30372.1 hypothetical protein K9N68_34790 [Kovacikia minuta CCNUW1]
MLNLIGYHSGVGQPPLTREFHPIHRSTGGLAEILQQSQKPGFLRESMRETLDIWFRNPVSLPLLRMVQDVS